MRAAACRVAVIASRIGSEGRPQSPACSKTGRSRSTPSSLRATLTIALAAAIASPYGSNNAVRGSDAGSSTRGNAPGACDAVSGAPAS